MPQSDFYSVNLQRAYPLVELPTSDAWYAALADIQFTVRPSAGFRDGYHSIYLTTVGLINSDLAQLLGDSFLDGNHFLGFECSAPRLAGQMMLFPAPQQSSKFLESEGVVATKQMVYAELNQTSDAPFVEADPKMWQGWAVIGRVAELPTSATIVTPAIPVEPARVKNIVEPVYTGKPGSVYVHNKNRAIYSDPVGCEHITEQSNEVHALPYPLVCGPIDHPVRIGGGVQVSSGSQSGNRVIQVVAKVGEGDLPLPCEPLPIVEGESSRNGFGFDGAPGCEDVLRRINGVSGPNLNIIGRSGIRVENYPTLNRIVVDLAASPSATCVSTTSPEPVEHLPTDDLGRNCGDDGDPHPDPGDPDGGAGYTQSTTTGGVTPLPGIDCSGTECVYENVDGIPKFVSGNCQSPCGCPDPPESIPEGQQVSLPCEEVPLDDPFNRVRNPDFIDEPPFNGWLAVSTIEWLDSYIGLPPSEFPMLKFSGNNFQLLEQEKIRVKRNRTYSLVADFWLLNGAELLFRVMQEDGTILLDRTVSETQYRVDFHIGYFASPDEYVKLRVFWAPGQASQTEALFSRPAIIEA